MKEHGGAIVNVSSVAGIKPAPGIGRYGAGKAMLTHTTQELAAQLAPDIRVNAVAPAVVKTTFAIALYEGRDERAAPIVHFSAAGFLRWAKTTVFSVYCFLLWS